MILIIYFLEHNYDPRFENEESTVREKSVDLSDMSPIEGDEEEMKEDKGFKIWTPNKLLAPNY